MNFYQTGTNNAPVRNGFSSFTGVSEVHDITIKSIIKSTEYISASQVDIETLAHRSIIDKLARELISKQLVFIDKHKDHITGNMIFTGNMLVAPPGIKMLKVEHEVYHLQNENFDELEIGKALLNTYPEKFI